MDESREKRDTSQVFTDRSASPTVRNGTWIPAMSWSNIVIILSIIILLVATLISYKAIPYRLYVIGYPTLE